MSRNTDTEAERLRSEISRVADTLEDIGAALRRIGDALELLLERTAQDALPEQPVVDPIQSTLAVLSSHAQRHILYERYKRDFPMWPETTLAVVVDREIARMQQQR